MNLLSPTTYYIGKSRMQGAEKYETRTDFIQQN